MKSITKYYCDHCGARFDDDEKCREHETVCGNEKSEIGKRLAKEFDKLVSEAHKAHIKIDALCPKDICGVNYNIETERIELMPF